MSINMKRIHKEYRKLKKCNMKKVQYQKVSHEKVATGRQHEEKLSWKKAHHEMSENVKKVWKEQCRVLKMQHEKSGT